jgi:cytochrome P450
LRRLAALLRSDPEAMADPCPVLNELRERAPVYRFDGQVLITRYRDVAAVLRDTGSHISRALVEKSGTALAGRAGLRPEVQVAYDEVVALESLHLVRTDPPQHDRLRRIASRAFTPNRIARMRESVHQSAVRLIEAFDPDGEVEMLDLAYGLPMNVIADLLGVPHDDAVMLQQWTKPIVRNKGATGLDEDVILAARAAHADLGRYVQQMVDEGRSRDRHASDLVAALFSAEHEERLTLDELTAMFAQLILAGYETTANLISIGMLELLRRPEQWGRLCAHPELAPQATEELLRYTSVAQWQPRIAVEPVELSGERIEAGETVILMMVAANRDPEVFEEPDRLDVTRANANRHIAFGTGLHHCLGAALARTECTTVLSELCRRFPGMSLAGDVHTWHGAARLRALDSLRVRLTPAA